MLNKIVGFAAGWKGYAMLAGAMLLAGFAAGWRVNQWRNDSIDLAEERGVQHAISEFRAREASIAAEAETRIQALRTTERVTHNQITKEIINNATIYSTDCATVDGVRAYNAFASTIASKPVAALPR